MNLHKCIVVSAFHFKASDLLFQSSRPCWATLNLMMSFVIATSVEVFLHISLIKICTDGCAALSCGLMTTIDLFKLKFSALKQQKCKAKKEKKSPRERNSLHSFSSCFMC